MTYQVDIIHPKAAALLHTLAELGLISIEEENNGSSEAESHLQEKASKNTLANFADCKKSETAKEGRFNYDDLPPITKSLVGAFEAPDETDYKKMKTERLAKKYDRESIPPIIKSMLGAFEASDDFDYKEELTKALADKYL